MFSRKEDDVDTAKVEIDPNESQEITQLRTDLARYYGIKPEEVEARADELSLPDDVRQSLESLYGRRIVGYEGGRNANAFNGLILPDRTGQVYAASDSTKPV